MRVIALDVRIILLADFMKSALPQIKGEGQDVGLPAECQLFILVALAGEIEGIAQTPLDPSPGVDAFLHRHFIGSPLKNKTPGPGIKSLVIFAHHDEINIRWFLIFKRAETLVVKFHRPQIDVLLQLKTRAQQNPLFQNARLHLRMANGSQQNRWEFPQFGQDAVREGFARAKITLAAEIVWGVVQFYIKFLPGDVKNFDRLGHDFGAGAIAADDCNIEAFH